MAKKAGGISVEQIVPGDATALLEQDHREVEAFFEQFEHLDNNAEKQKLAARICLALTVHAQIEEELIYPLARKNLEEADLVEEAEVEHAAAKQLISEIEDMSPRDKLFDAKVKVLGEYVKHHVHEEENELFPKMRKADFDFYKLGEKLAARKIALLIEARA
jgi:hemerythrin superfamily protein